MRIESELIEIYAHKPEGGYVKYIGYLFSNDLIMVRVINKTDHFDKTRWLLFSSTLLRKEIENNTVTKYEITGTIVDWEYEELHNLMFMLVGILIDKNLKDKVEDLFSDR